MKELITIQTNLKANKDKFNTFGKYKYRSCESILEALKPLLNATDCHVTLTDEPVIIGTRYYIKATATITNSTGETTSVSACAREEEEKKGMDGSQITGTASSYARKFALCGLFAIDDGVDSDLTNTGEEKPKKTAKPTNTDDEKPTKQAKIDTSLPLETIFALISEFNENPVVTPAFAEAIKNASTLDELRLINSLIADAWKVGGKVQNDRFSQLMNQRAKELRR